MIHLPASVRVYLCTVPCDMRRSFDGLHALAAGAMQLDSFEGHLFVFSNRHCDRVKIMYWGVSRRQGNLPSCTKDGSRPPGAGSGRGNRRWS
jgi:hypothetical protein